MTIRHKSNSMRKFDYKTTIELLGLVRRLTQLSARPGRMVRADTWVAFQFVNQNKLSALKTQLRHPAGLYSYFCLDIHFFTFHTSIIEEYAPLYPPPPPFLLVSFSKLQVDKNFITHQQQQR